ncbi:MAG: HEAT repeat domain-containing protein [Roseiarcus sp.]
MRPEEIDHQYAVWHFGVSMAYFSEPISDRHKEQYPELVRLIRNASLTSGQITEDCFSAVSEFFHSGFLARFLSSELQELARNVAYENLVSDKAIELVRLSSFTIWFGRLQSSSFWEDRHTELASFANDLVYFNAGPGSVTYEVYSAPPEQINELFDRRSFTIRSDSGIQRPGDFIKLRAGVDILKIVEMCDDLFELYVVSHTKQKLVWHYDAETISPLYSSAGRGQASSVEQAIELIVNLEGKSGIDAIVAAYNSEEHFVRWAAVKAALALDVGVGIELLERAKADPHPHVRHAADRTANLLKRQVRTA